MKKLLCSALLLAMTLAAQAEVKLPKIFGDNMVLQQQTECNLWGTADANKVVKVRASWNGKTYKTQADAQGKSAAGFYGIQYLDVVLLLDFPKVFADSFPDGVLLWLIIVLFFHFFLLFNCCLQLSPSSKWKGSS